MHRLRKELLARLILVVLVFGGIGYYGFDAVSGTIAKAARFRSRPFKVKNVGLPADKVRDSIAMGISLVEEKGRGGKFSNLTPSLVEKEGRVETAKLTMIARGQRERYAMIDEHIYRVGDTLPDGRRVRALNADGVLLSAFGQSEMIPWLPPLKVELKKSVPAPTAEEKPADEETAVENPVEEKAQKVVMNADKAMQLLKQLGAQSEGK